MEENNFVPPSDAVVTKSKKSNFVPPTDAILKKKVDSKPRSQEELWGSDSQPQDLYTSLATGAQEPQQESDGLGGPPKMKTFTGLTPEEQQTLQAKPAEKKPVINKEIQEKIIKAEFKPKEYRDAGSRLIDKLATGSSQLGATLATIPEYGYELSVAPQKFIAEIFNIPSLNPDTEEFKKQADSRNAVKNYYQKEVSDLKEKSTQLDQQYSQGVYDSFINGDYTGGFEQLTNSFTESLPTTAAIMVGGAYAKAPQILAASTMLFGTEKSEQLRKENPELTANARIANSLASGFAQAITETIGSASIGSAAKALVAREGEKKSISILKDGLIDYYKSSLKKVPLTAAAVGEGVEEWSSQVAENAVDVATGVKPQDYNVFEGGSDALLGGVFGGIVFGAGLTGIKNTVNYQDRMKIKENNKNIFNLQSQLENQSLTPEIKEEIDSKIEQLILENKKYVQDDVSKIESLPDDVKEKLVSSTNKIDELTSKAKEINSSDEITIETKAILLEGLKKEAVENAQLKNSILNGTYIEDRAVETPTVEEVAVKPSGQKVTDVINRPATLESQAGVKLETPIEGDVYQEGQRVIFEDKNKKVYDLGNIDEVSDKTVEELGIKPQEEMVSVTPEGKVKVGENEWNMQSDLPNYGIEYDNDGNVKAVSLKDDAGKTVMYEGQVAEDAAYQVLLKQTETPEQRQAINEILENDEELNRQLREAEEATQTTAVEVTEPGAPKTQAEQYSEELDKTKESDPEAYWSVSPVSAADAAKGTIIDTPDGAAIVKPDGDIAGLFKKATSKAKGVAQDLLKRAVAAGGRKLDNFDTYLTPQYIKAGFRVVSRVPFSLEYGVPPGYNKEKHGTPDVVAMVYDPEGKLDIEEKTFDDYDEAMAYRDSFLEPSIDAELEGLAKLFDESEKGFRMSQVDKAKEALKRILPGVEFIVHETNEAYKKATGESGSGGMYIYSAGGDKVIHINKQKANGRTVAHEVFHAVILDKIKGDKAVQEITARMVDAVYKTASPELRAELDAFAARYSDKTIRDEERLAELIGIIADGYPKMSQINKGIVKRWLEKLAKMFGRKPFTDNEVIDLLNTLAGKISTGEVISEGDVSILGYGSVKIKKDIKRESKFIDSLVFNRFPTNENTKVLENFDLSTIDGQVAASTLSDKLTAGELKKYKLVDGEKVLESVYTFFGGIGYPEVTGRVWAASEESGVNRIIDDMKVSSDGYKYLIPAVMSNVSHMSNKNMTSITMEVFKEAINNKELNRDVFKKLILNSFDKGSPKDLKDGAIKAISGNISAIKMADNLRDYILSSKMTFQSRRDLLEKMVGNSEVGNPKFSTVGTFLSLATSLADPIAKEVDLHQVPVIIRTKGNLKAVKTDTNDKFYHESYGYHIESDQVVEVLHLDGVYNLTDIIPEFVNLKGETVSTANELKEKGAKGWDIKNILTNLGRTHGMSKYSAKIVSKKRSQLEENKTIPAGNRLFNKPLPEAKEIADKYYKKTFGKDREEFKGTRELDKENAKRISDAFIAMKHDPNNPKVKASYRAMARETLNQYKYFLKSGYKIEINNEEPYSNSEAVIEDLRNNKRIKIFSTESGFGDNPITAKERSENPLLKDSGYKDANGQPLLINDVFRAVHDFFGHAELGNSFGPLGEENAWNVHARMYSDIAKGAVTTETRGQNSYVNFSGVNKEIDLLREKARKFREEGNIEEADKITNEIYEKGKFADQKIGLLPEEFTKFPEDKTIERLQQTNDINEIVRIAKEAKYSDAAISAFLKAKGFSDAEITSALSTDRPSVNKIYEDSKKAIDDKKKRVSIKDLAPFLRKSLLDRQAYIKRVINRIDNKSAKKAYDLLVTKAGASALASERFKRAEKKIYGGLSSEDVSTLDKIIYAKRMVAVNESRAKLGLEPYKGMDGYSIDDANRDLADFKNSLGDKKFNDLSNRATEYFDVFKLNLKKLYESGRISEETYESLKDTEYSPIKTIKYIIGDNLSVDEIDTQAKSLGISRNDIMKLSDNNENEIILDSKWLLAMSINSVEGRAFENNMLREFDKAIKEATPEEKKAFEDIILDNPVVGTKKDGGLKYKYDDTRLPVGYTKVSYFNDGNKVEIVLKDQYAKQLLDVKNKNKALETLGKLTGTKILRFFATGGNPLFIIGNTAVDFQNIAFFSDVYSKFKPMATAQLARDYTKNFVKKLFVSNEYNKVFNEYINHGGALDYMASDGLRSLESMNPVKGVTKAVQKGLVAYGRAMSLLGETSEVAFRLSVFQKVKEDSIKDFKKENNREPNAQELDDIMWNAGRQSRETMDFSQGGDVAKNIDAVFPYFNAALQGIRRPIDFAKKDPVGFSSSVLQYTVMASSLAAGSFAMLINAVGGDDDEDRTKKIMDAMNSLSEYEKANYHIMFTGEKNKDGEYEYYRVKKLPVLSVISTVAEQLIYKEFFNSKGIDYDMDSKVMLEAVNKSNPLPVTVQELAGKNPVASGLVSYWANKDTFTGDKIFREPDNKKILPEAEGMFDDRVDQIYKDLAPGFGLSPARTKVMVEKVITSANTNPTIPLIYSAYDGLFNKSDGLGSEVKEAMSGVGDAFGKKVVRYTDKKIIRYKDQDEKEYQESLLETKVWNSEQKVYNEIKKKYDGGGNLTKKELIDLVKENFEPMDYMKYAKKYNAYIHNMNIDKSVLDIIFEDVPEVQAMKLNQRYGPNLEGEELKELGKAMNSAGKRINNKSIYIYNKKYKNRKNAQ